MSINLGTTTAVCLYCRPWLVGLEYGDFEKGKSISGSRSLSKAGREGGEVVRKFALSASCPRCPLSLIFIFRAPIQAGPGGLAQEGKI